MSDVQHLHLAGFAVFAVVDIFPKSDFGVC